MLTPVLEDALRAIFELPSAEGFVSNGALAARLGVAPASAHQTVKRLAGLDLVVHHPYQGVRLTAAGRVAALRLVRHHRLIELWLAETLAVPWDEVHAIAEQWEHGLSETLEERMDMLLGHPTTNPHGAPIPASDGSVPPAADQVCLNALRLGEAGVIRQVSDQDPALLRYLAEQALRPGVPVRLLARAPLHGPLTLAVGADQCVVGEQVAEAIFVSLRDAA